MHKQSKDGSSDDGLGGDLSTDPKYSWSDVIRECNCWPDADQYLLLQTILTADNEKALRCWAKFCSNVDIQKLAFATTSLLPLAYHRLRKFSGRDTLQQTATEFATAKSIYRHTWSRNHLDLHTMHTLLNVLKDQEITVTLLKGGAMITNFYRDPGLRVIGDLDLLVERKDVLQASEILTRAGWVTKAPLSKAKEHAAQEPLISKNSSRRIKDALTPPIDQPITHEILRLRHAHSFVNRNGLHIDLHWRVFGEAPRDHWLANFKFTTTPVNDLDRANRSNLSLAASAVDIKVLCPEDQLIHTLVHGARQSPGCSFVRWIPDSAWIIKSTPGLRWDYVIRQAKSLRATYLLTMTLSYLQHEGFVQLPDAVDARIKNLRFSINDQRWIECLMQDHNEFQFQYRYTWRTYVRAYPERGIVSKLLGIGSYLKTAYGLPSNVALLRLVIEKGGTGFIRRLNSRFITARMARLAKKEHR